MAADLPVASCSVVFDIDGVLALGKAAIPGAAEAVRRLASLRVPWICLTNGGGDTEAGKADRLSSMLGVPVHPEQIVMSFSPLRPICTDFRDKRVLVIGQEGGRQGGKAGIAAVCRSLGLQKAVTTRQLISDDPHRFAALEPPVTEHTPIEYPDEPFAAVMILDDPTNWGLDIQLICDVLRGGSPLGTGVSSGALHARVQQSVPVYSAQCDFTYAGRHPAPRFTMGAFQVALNAVWKAYCTRLGQADSAEPDVSCRAHGQQGSGPMAGDLSIHQYGKPTKATFDYALDRARRWALMAEEIGAHERIAGVAHSVNCAGASTSSTSTGPASTPPATGCTGPQPVHSLGQWTVHELQQHADVWQRVSGVADACLPAFPGGVFMVGDNPASDIAGANAAARPWSSILVKTGVFQGPSNDSIHPAHMVCENVCEAVSRILSAGIERS